MTGEQTPSQTIGPFFAVGLTWADGPFVVPEGSDGAVWLRGMVLDGAGDAVPDAMVETWQASSGGRFVSGEERIAPAGFRGFGRSCTDSGGGYAILTCKPGGLAAPGGLATPAGLATPVRLASAVGRRQAPHIDISVFARGLLKRVVTRAYFGDEEAANATDPVLAGIADPRRRATLLAAPSADGYHFDVHLQGNDETVFFEF
jgi:protocatechuate 3,4-dioxygenase, alpha subunit